MLIHQAATAAKRKEYGWEKKKTLIRRMEQRRRRERRGGVWKEMLFVMNEWNEWMCDEWDFVGDSLSPAVSSEPSASSTHPLASVIYLSFSFSFFLESQLPNTHFILKFISFNLINSGNLVIIIFLQLFLILSLSFYFI